jgi:hypothetical protein
MTLRHLRAVQQLWFSALVTSVANRHSAAGFSLDYSSSWHYHHRLHSASILLHSTPLLVFLLTQRLLSVPKWLLVVWS